MKEGGGRGSGGRGEGGDNRSAWKCTVRWRQASRPDLVRGCVESNGIVRNIQSSGCWSQAIGQIQPATSERASFGWGWV